MYNKLLQATQKHTPIYRNAPKKAFDVGRAYVPMIPTVALNRKTSWVGPDLSARQAMYHHSIKNNDTFWHKIAAEGFYWKTPVQRDRVKSFNFHRGKGPIFVKWFEGAATNVCYNALDRHIATDAERVAFYFEGNEPGVRRTITYGEMHAEVQRLGNVLRKDYGLVKGDRVCLYMPMVPEAVAAMLACARIGVVVTVVFAGFSAQALSTRLQDSDAKLVITADGSGRGSKPIDLKKIVDEALDVSGSKAKCLVVRNNGGECAMTAGRDAWYHEALKGAAAECPIEWMDAEDPLFLLYTSGSTGKPKGIVHTTGGYMVYAATTFKYTFDYHREDVYFCTADIGWITGHSYVVYGPMLNCATQVLYEGVPTYPDASRWWQMVDRYKVSIFYTAPTAVRSLMQVGNEFVTKTDRSSLRILGSVGEPINSEAWKWLHDVAGSGHVDVVDTWWQTETGGHMLTPLPGCTPQKPGCASLPFFGVEPVLLDPMTHEELQGEASGLLAMKRPWPGMLRTVLGDQNRFETGYFNEKGHYLSGDAAYRDQDGYIWIEGRVDDVLNVSGHRIGTSEVEEAVNSHPAVVESAVVGVPHDVKGESIYVFLTFHNGTEITPALLNDVKMTVRKLIGPLATPDVLHPAQAGLPKTRSGKIVRRVLRKVAVRKVDDLGDTSTMADPTVVKALLEYKP